MKKLVYSPRMRYFAKPILVLACLSFLTIQIVGSHLHADYGEHNAEESHGINLQNVFSHDDGHDNVHIDVSVFDSAATLLKVDNIIIESTTPILLVTSVVGSIWRNSMSRPFKLDRLRWRPLLRAPPLTP